MSRWETPRSHASTTPCGRMRRNSDITLVSRRNIRSRKLGRSSPAQASTPRQRNIHSRLVGEKQFFQRCRRGLPHPSPVIDGHEYGCLGPVLRYDLRALAQARIEKFAEPGFRILHRPSLHIAPVDRLVRKLVRRTPQSSGYDGRSAGAGTAEAGPVWG
jgi:hypothetical protein